MKFWAKRKKSVKSQAAALSLEKLEDRALMAVIPLLSGQLTTFQDADGTQVKVKLIGPGQGSLELTNGLLTGAAIDSLMLSDTTAASKLKITTRGGTVSGTTINELVITKALGELGALKDLLAKQVDFSDSGQFVADGSVGNINFRSLGEDATVEVDGNLDRLKVETLKSDSSVEVSGTLRDFVVQFINTGAHVSADQLDMLKVKQQAQGATFDVGTGGLGKATIKNLYNSAIASEGDIGKIHVQGDAIASAFVSNIDAGSDGVFGTIDDFVIDRSATGNIGWVKLRGNIGANGTDQEVGIVASGSVGRLTLSRSARNSGGSPAVWEQAASGIIPLSVIQAATDATGFSDDQIWIAVFGQQLAPGAASGPSYYLDASNINGGIPTLVTTSGLTPSSTTPNLATLPSFTLQQWKDASQNWGSNLAFPTPPNGDEWSGRIVISLGAPVQAQVNANGTVSAPSPIDPTDPSTGTFYDFLEFTVTTSTSGSSSLDIDTSLVDSFGIPMKLQLLQPSPGVIAFDGTTDTGSPMITGITSTTGILAGQYVVGAGIPLGARVDTVTSSTVTLNMNASASSVGVSLMAVDWDSFNLQVTGTFNPNSNVITGIPSTTLNNLIVNSGLGTGQPVIAVGVLPPGTAIESYVINAGGGNATITLTKAALGSVTPNFSTMFTVEPAGPVGVEALRDVITGTGADSLIDFLNLKIAGGSSQARPFLESANPYLLSGPVPISGVVPGIGAIQVTTSGTNVLSDDDVVQISGVLGNTIANGEFAVNNISSTSFSLKHPVSNGSFTSGGNWSVVTPTTITGATYSPAVITTGSTTGLNDNNSVTVTGVLGNTAVNGQFVATNVTPTTFTLGGPIGSGAYVGGTGYWSLPNAPTTPITDAIAGSQIVINTGNTLGLADGDLVSISGVTGVSGANGVFTVTGVNADSFTLSGVMGTGTYLSGGAWQVVQAISGATNNSDAIAITTDTPSLLAGTVVEIAGVQGNTAANGLFVATNVTGTGFTLGTPAGTGAYTSGGTWTGGSGSGAVTDATRGGEALITTAATTGLANGDTVVVSGVSGNAAANGTYTVANVTATTFTLDGTLSNGPYTYGGIWNETPIASQAITGAMSTGTGPITVDTADTTGLMNGDIVQITGVGGNTAANGLFIVNNVMAGSFELGSPVGNGAFGTNAWSMAITGASNAGPIVITTSNTAGLVDNDLVEVTGVKGNAAANGVYYIANVTATTFELVGSTGSGAYTFGGTWKEYSPLTRLISPKDLVEGLASPQDESALNNYYNQVIDDFFLKYLPSDQMAGGQNGGGEVLLLPSNASGSEVLYGGYVTNENTANGGYVMRFSPAQIAATPGVGSVNSFDPNTLDVYYPFFTSNSPSPDVYTPLFTVADAPSWIIAANQQFESASQMIFACDAVFADNVERIGIGMSTGQAKIVADLENSISAAFNRGIVLNGGDTWSDSSEWFPANGTYNYWVEYWHQDGLTVNDLAYAFPYDDRFGASTNLDTGNVGLTLITLGSWSATKSASTTTFQGSSTASTTQQGSATLAVTVTGSTPSGTVNFFIDGIPLNSNNNSTFPTLQPITLAGGMASITANLPPTADAGNTHTYTVTAVYSGDSTNLPSIATWQLEIIMV
jgi:hypothetical protein